MAIPAEGGLVKQYKANFANGAPADTAVTVYFTEDGTSQSADRSPQMQGQGAAIFLDNPSTVGITADIYATVKIYGAEYDVKLGSFEVAPSSDAGYSVGYGLIRKNLRVVLKNQEDMPAAAAVTVAIVPSNG